MKTAKSAEDGTAKKSPPSPVCVTEMKPEEGGACADRTRESEKTEKVDDSSGGNKMRKLPLPIRAAGRLVLFVSTSSLVILWSALLLSYSTCHVFDKYITPIMVASEQFKALQESRKLEWEARDSQTYYERYCDANDITAESQEEITWEGEVKNEYENFAEVLMRHGAGIIPDILSRNTTSNLRKTILRMNAEEPMEKQFSLKEHGHRWALRLNPYNTKNDPEKHVQTALKEIASDPTVSSTLRKLLGPDPAMVELAAISSEPGALEQAYHCDTWYDASCLRYARSYTSVYSMFVYLQDTYEDMGATGICIGSHMCSYMDNSECIFAEPKAGSAVILNSNIYHQGSGNDAHHRRDGTRVMFIITFASRPRPETDPRQLPLGSVYGIPWYIWGHNLSEFLQMDQLRWNPLHALGILKSGKNWGWNYILGAIASHAEGAYAGNHDEWFLERPLWDDYFHKVSLANAAAFAIFFFLVITIKYVAILFNLSSNKTSLYYGFGIHYLIKFCSFSLLLATASLYAFSHTKFARSVTTGKRFTTAPFKPFSPSQITPEYLDTIAYPRVIDVLFGERLDAYYMFQNTYFYDYHPGNYHYRDLLKDEGYNYIDVPHTAKKLFIQTILNNMQNGIRFLRQNNYGLWEIMKNDDIIEATRKEIIGMKRPIVRSLSKEISFILSQCKYGDGGRNYGARISPRTAMSRKHTPDLMKTFQHALYAEPGWEPLAVKRMDITQLPFSMPSFLHSFKLSKTHALRRKTILMENEDNTSSEFQYADPRIYGNKELQDRVRKYGVLQVINIDDETLEAVEDMLYYMENLESEILENVNRVTINSFLKARECKNRDPHCAYWAASGLCEDKEYEKFMTNACMPSCEWCWYLYYNEEEEEYAYE